MSIINTELKITLDTKGNPLDVKSLYKATEQEKEAISLVKESFVQGDETMNKPRREYNDLSVKERMTIDQMAYNTYQPNDGEPLEGDEVNAWKSQAMKPIVRNKIVSIAAHATARLIFPKIFAYDKKKNDEQKEAATVMSDLMEWCAEQSNYDQVSFYSIISALVNPAALIHSDYVEAYKATKGEKDADGKRIITYVKDEKNSGFKDTVVPVDELYIANIYEHDIQKQDWLVWRKVQSYDLLKAKYAQKYDNFQYVKPGMQLIYDNANNAFYEVYDTELTGDMGEEIIYWNKALDVKLIMVNGCLLTDFDNPNPRIDKEYPWVKFGYELVDEGKFFYYKSLAFKMKQDANIINSLYPIIIDGSYLSVIPPVKFTGAEAFSGDVIIPGAAITLSSPDADVAPIRVGQDLAAGLNMLNTVEQSINESSQDPIQSGQQSAAGSQTAYEISKIEANANTVLGLFIKMISFFVRDYGYLRISDIIQYLTIAEIDKITNGTEAIYKSFLLPGKMVNGKQVTRKIMLDGDMSDEDVTGEEAMKMSYEIMKLENQYGNKVELYKVNPRLIRDMKYDLKVSPDVIQPTSEELKRAYALEAYDRMIANPLANQEETFKMLLSVYPETKLDVEKYITKPQPMPTTPPPMAGGMAPQGATPAPLTTNAK